MSERDYTIKSAGYCLDILMALGTPDFSTMNESDLADKLDIGWNQAFRALKTLESRGLVEKSGKAWMLTPKVIRLAEGYRVYLDKQKARLAEMEEKYLGQKPIRN